MHDISGSATPTTETTEPIPTGSARRDGVVSTHVLVAETDAEKLRELSRKTRVAQSEYLREAVDDLLGKYGKRPPEEK